MLGAPSCGMPLIRRCACSRFSLHLARSWRSTRRQEGCPSWCKITTCGLPRIQKGPPLPGSSPPCLFLQSSHIPPADFSPSAPPAPFRLAASPPTNFPSTSTTTTQPRKPHSLTPRREQDLVWCSPQLNAASHGQRSPKPHPGAPFLLEFLNPTVPCIDATVAPGAAMPQRPSRHARFPPRQSSQRVRAEGQCRENRQRRGRGSDSGRGFGGGKCAEAAKEHDFASTLFHGGQPLRPRPFPLPSPHQGVLGRGQRRECEARFVFVTLGCTCDGKNRIWTRGGNLS
jgi:hypothetical protein